MKKTKLQRQQEGLGREAAAAAGGGSVAGAGDQKGNIRPLTSGAAAAAADGLSLVGAMNPGAEDGDRCAQPQRGLAAEATAALTPFPAGTIGDGEFDFRPFFLNRSGWYG